MPEQHHAALNLLAEGGQFTVADTACIETIFVLGRAYELNRAQQREAIMGLLNHPQIVGNSKLFLTAFELYEVHPELSFEDCYLVSQADFARSRPLWTFDKNLANQTAVELLA